MNFAKQQAIDLFGEEEEDQTNPNPQDPTHQSSTSATSSSASSSAASSSAASSSASSSSSNSQSASDDDEVHSFNNNISHSINNYDDQNYYNNNDGSNNLSIRNNSNAYSELFGNESDEEEAEVEIDKDLFGSDNEDYVKTPLVSPYPVPVLPQVRSSNNNPRGGLGRGRWNNDRGGPGLLPRPGPYPQRQGYGYGRGNNFNVPRDERLVADMKFAKSEETLARKCIQFQAPCELACYSRAEGGDVYFDDRSLRLFKRLITEDIGADLNEGFDTFVEKKDLGSKGFGDLLTSIRNKNIPLQNMHFVTYRNNLNKILATAYIRHEPWEMGVHRRKGVVYLDVHKLPERPQSEMERRRSYWGYCFETLATEDPNRFDGEGIHDVDANVEFCSVLKTKLGAHRILMGAEMDCCDSTDDGKRFYVELKTSRELEYHTEERFEREKLLKFWIQSFLAGVPYIVIGYRDDAGRLVRTERLRTKDITQRVKAKNYWQGGVCLAFADEVLCWLYGTVKENQDYILQFAPPFTRLELLQAQSCPVEIDEHVEQL
ncbi:hypothetical protein LIER_30895 [Lithospermum erythrorhizon]|uniref:Decapping nuclease n=1 Tax=Lithospermum erythrorhizon TaxID=34254 RepID=A0AAV3RR82_LITER